MAEILHWEKVENLMAQLRKADTMVSYWEIKSNPVSVKCWKREVKNIINQLENHAKGLEQFANIKETGKARELTLGMATDIREFYLFYAEKI